jgi:hypothetical protein
MEHLASAGSALGECAVAAHDAWAPDLPKAAWMFLGLVIGFVIGQFKFK